jgi:short-subunit dehydrogenase
MATFPWKRAVVVGASSGIGAEIARRLAQAGCRVALVARRQERLEKAAQEMNRAAGSCLAFAYGHDVRDVGDVPALFTRIVLDLGGLDLVVYASGTMPAVAVEEYDSEKDARIIAVNLTGAVAWLNEAAKRFEKLGAGTIVGLSSVAGDRGRRGSPVYGATKAALNVYLESLRNRIERRGAFVVTVKAGPVRTAMTEGLKMPFMIPVEQAAKEILTAAQDRERVVYVPVKWRLIMTVIRSIPASIFKWLNI